MSAIGRSPEDLSIQERFDLAGKWIALERYAPTSVVEVDGKPQVGARLRRIEALGNSSEECIRQLQTAGHDPAQFEFTRIKPPFGGLS
jgi:hypothetical protein